MKEHISDSVLEMNTYTGRSLNQANQEYINLIYRQGDNTEQVIREIKPGQVLPELTPQAVETLPIKKEEKTLTLRMLELTMLEKMERLYAKQLAWYPIALASLDKRVRDQITGLDKQQFPLWACGGQVDTTFYRASCNY